MTIHVAAAYNKGMLDGTANIKTSAVSGKLRIYSGTQPADGDAAITGTLLAELSMPNPAFSGPAGTTSADQVLTAGTISSVSASATGTATHFRLWDSAGTTRIMDGSAGTSGTDLVLNTTSFTSGGAVTVTSLTVTMPK